MGPRRLPASAPDLSALDSQVKHLSGSAEGPSRQPRGAPGWRQFASITILPIYIVLKDCFRGATDRA